MRSRWPTMRDMKKVGTSEATVHFHKEVEVKIPVTVVAENQPASAGCSTGASSTAALVEMVLSPHIKIK